jgi:hypothetical protein
MQEYRLSFGIIRMLSDRIAEVVVDEGIEMTLETVAEYHEFLLDHLPNPSGILINKTNSYAYNFEAQQNLFLLEHIHCYAVLVHNTSAWIATESLMNMQRQKNKVNLTIFDQFHEALKWLAKELGCPVPEVEPQYFPSK